MTLSADATLREVAFVVCTALDDAGIVAVLTGGGAATVHAPGAIQSYDLDFVLTLYPGDGDGESVLRGLGYRREGHDYIHTESKYALEFPPGPLAIGDELIETWSTLRERDRLLHLLSPTDSCRDRLAAFYHFADRSALEQALEIQRAQRDDVDLDRIRRWSHSEGHGARFREFFDRID